MAEISLRVGDCLDAMTDIPDGSVDMVFADLPYGVTCNRWDTVIPFEPLWRELLRVGPPRCAFVFTATQPFATALINSQPKLFRYDIIWDKCSPTGHLNANRQPLRRHECLCIFSRQASIYNPQKVSGKPYTHAGRGPSKNYGAVRLNEYGFAYDGARYPTSIFACAMGKRASMVHPTQKPVALLEWLIRTYSNPGDTVLDPTMGSGTTGVACVNTGRQFIGIEKDPGYFLTAQRRVAQAGHPT